MLAIVCSVIGLGFWFNFLIVKPITAPTNPPDPTTVTLFIYPLPLINYFAV